MAYDRYSVKIVPYRITFLREKAKKQFFYFFSPLKSDKKFPGKQMKNCRLQVSVFLRNFPVLGITGVHSLVILFLAIRKEEFKIIQLYRKGLLSEFGNLQFVCQDNYEGYNISLTFNPRSLAKKSCCVIGLFYSVIFFAGSPSISTQR